MLNMSGETVDIKKEITGINLDAYFERIGYAGSTNPSLKTLKAIILKHTATIPFENLNPLLRWPVMLDMESLRIIEKNKPVLKK